MAGGQPIADTTADAAAEWLTLLMSGEATPLERRRFDAWHAADPEHERAWRHIEAVAARFHGLHGGAAYRSLSPHAPARRKHVKTLLWLVSLGGVGGTALLASRTPAWQAGVADYSSPVGQRRDLTLIDGSRIVLNTGSAVNVRFDGQRRVLQLVAGEIMIVTGHADGDQRPFFVATGEGLIRALGTRFTVRQFDGRTAVAVLDSAVEVQPANGQAQRMQAGRRLSFSRTATGPQRAIDEQTAAWTDGQFIADNVRLDDFLSDISRYRHGVLRANPAVAGLRFSGVFPLSDTDRILALLPNSLPVQVRSRSRYWVTVEPG